MARRSETSLGTGHMIWRLEHCEAVVLIAAWLRVKGRVPPTERWTFDFEHRFFERGDAVSERYLSSINRHLRRIGGEEVWFDETNVSEYVRNGDKVTWLQDRHHIKESIQSMDTNRRAQFVGDAMVTMEGLEPAHRNYEEWKREFRPTPRIEAPRSLARIVEVPIPMAAVEQVPAAIARPPAAVLPGMPVDLAMKLLDQTTDPEIKNQLVKLIVGSFAVPGRPELARPFNLGGC